MFDSITYQNEKFLRILENVYQIDRVRIFKDDKLNNLTTFYKSRNKKKDIFNMPFSYYHSPKIPIENQNEIFKELVNYSLSNKINLRIKSLINYQFENKVLYANNPIIDLSKDLEYSKNLKQNINRNNNKCNKHEIYIYKSIKEDDLNSFYNYVLAPIYIKKHKMVFQPLQLYIELLRNGFIDFFIAVQNKKILGGLICIKDQKTLHYNWGASLKYENIAIGTMLINHAIKYAIINKYEYFDMGSTPLSDKNLFDFKMKWGATNYPVYQYYTLEKPSLIDLNNSYILARNIYSKFPNSFLKWLVPKIIPLLVQ